MLIDNVNDPEASVKGAFVFQKKGRDEKWEDVPLPNLSTLKKGDEVNLPIKSKELRKLFDELRSLYQLVASDGIPMVVLST